MAIIDAILALGKSLDLTVIAEGVETQEQATLLKDKGCEQVQGYFYSKPLSCDDLEKLLKTILTSLKVVLDYSTFTFITSSLFFLSIQKSYICLKS